MTSRHYTQLSAICLFIFISCAKPQSETRGVVRVTQSPPKPNVLLILVDDMAFHHMPHMPRTIAKLANLGVRFEQAFVASPVCGPNRASLWTGQYVHAHGIDCNAQSAMRFDTRPHLGEWLQGAGYRTGYFGKWLNGLTQRRMPSWPWVQPGWHDWRAFVGLGGYYGFDLIENGVIHTYGTAKYSTTVLGQMVRAFIDSTPADTPFAAVFAPAAPHEPFTPENSADLAYGASIPLPSTPAYNEADVSDKPSYIRALLPLTAEQEKGIRHRHKKQIATLQSVDRQIDAILTQLEQAGRLADTDVYFTDDNGFLMGEHRLDRDKGCIYEACIRVPLIVKMAGITPRIDTTHLVSTLDVTATIAARANATTPYELHGTSLVPILQDANAPSRDCVLIEYFAVGERPNFTAVRCQGDIYGQYTNGEKEYYDFTADPFQLENGVTKAAYAARVNALRTRLAVLRTQ